MFGIGLQETIIASLPIMLQFAVPFILIVFAIRWVHPPLEVAKAEPQARSSMGVTLRERSGAASTSRCVAA